MRDPFWRAALQAHEELLRHWRSPEGFTQSGVAFHLGRSFAEIRQAIAEDRLAEVMQGRKAWKDMTPAERGIELAPLVRRTVEHLNRATTWAVSAEMVRLVSHASQAMPSESIEQVDLPTPDGFALLEEPMWMREGSGDVLERLPRHEPGTPLREIPFRAFQWASDEESVDVLCYRARGDYATGEEPLRPEEERLLARYSLGVEFSWRWGDPTNPEGRTSQAAIFLKALWAISQQRIALVAHTPPDRAGRRRAERLGLPEDGTVRVVTLRKPARPTPEDQHVADVEWTHRWIVSGHWRNQYLSGSGMHRLQWIAPYVKGPEDKPLVLKDTVINVRR